MTNWTASKNIHLSTQKSSISSLHKSPFLKNMNINLTLLDNIGEEKKNQAACVVHMLYSAPCIIQFIFSSISVIRFFHYFTHSTLSVLIRPRMQFFFFNVVFSAQIHHNKRGNNLVK